MHMANSELSTHLQGQLVAVHPAYDQMFDNFAPDALKNNPKARTDWAVDQVKKAAIGVVAWDWCSRYFLGSLLWPIGILGLNNPKGLST